MCSRLIPSPARELEAADERGEGGGEALEGGLAIWGEPVEVWGLAFLRVGNGQPDEKLPLSLLEHLWGFEGRGQGLGGLGLRGEGPRIEGRRA